MMEGGILDAIFITIVKIKFVIFNEGHSTLNEMNVEHNKKIY